jgi:hypothetical protein
MAKRLKERLAQEAREQMKAQRRTVREQKEYEDANGIKRRISSGYSDGLSIKTVRKIKIFLLVCLPLAYFLYSVLLLPIVILYGLTYLPIKSKERNLNYGVREELRVSLPKFDSVIALILVVVVGALIGISSLTTSEQNSMFAGKSKAQIYAVLEARGMGKNQAENMAERIANSSASMTAAEKLLTQAGTLLTGQREFFVTKNSDMLGLGGGRKMFTGQRPDGGNGSPSSGAGGKQIFTRPPGGARPGGFPQGGFGKVNISKSLNEVLAIIDLVLLLTIFAGGVYSVIAINKHRQ